MVVAIIVVLVAIAGFAIYGAIHKNDVAKSTTEEQAYQQLQKVETKPSAADDKGGILISSEGYGKKVSGAPPCTWIRCAPAAASSTARPIPR